MESDERPPACSARARVNGSVVTIPDDTMTLIDWLRSTAGLNGPKKGCGEGHCGACTVLVDGKPTLSCCTFAAVMAGTDVTTAEGVVRTPLGERLATAFAEHGALQCGYCTPGMLVMAYSLLSRGHRVSESDVREALVGNVCRCTGYAQLIDAVLAV